MSNNKWSEQKIDQLLSHAPKLKDTRSKDKVLERLQQDSQLAKGKPKKRKIWLPPAVAVAALITLTLLVASIMNQPKNSMDSTSMNDSNYEESMEMDQGSEEAKTSISETGKNSTEEITTFESEEESQKNDTADLKIQKESILTSVYASDLENHTAFHIGLVSQDALVVPITFLITNEQIQNDFGELSPTSLQLYEQYAESIEEEDLGFIEYHPYLGTFEIDQEQLIHRLPQQHNYDLASASLYTYEQSLQYTFGDFTQIVHQNEDGSQAEFNQVGPMMPTVQMKGKYVTTVFPYKNTTDLVFMMPNLGEVFNDVTDAMTALKSSPNDFYISAVPASVNYVVEEKEKIVHIAFAEPLDLNSLSTEQAIQMIESFILTGANFDAQVQLDNVVQDQWKEIDFTQPLERPIGLNKYEYQ